MPNHQTETSSAEAYNVYPTIYSRKGYYSFQQKAYREIPDAYFYDKGGHLA